MAVFEIRHNDAVEKVDRFDGKYTKFFIFATEPGIGLVSLNDPVDTTTAQGRLVFNIFASLAEFERDIISERTRAGLQAARKRGRTGGRPKGLSEEAQQKAMIAETLYKEGKLTVNQICERLGIARATLYSYLRSRGWKQEG